MFNFVAQLTGLAHEAQSGARQALAAAGMLDSAYWASAALLELLLAALQASIIVLMTWALRFDLVSALQRDERCVWCWISVLYPFGGMKILSVCGSRWSK